MDEEMRERNHAATHRQMCCRRMAESVTAAVALNMRDYKLEVLCRLNFDYSMDIMDEEKRERNHAENHN